ncbi:MAG: LON peptidase substrate-binding domain-containing protein [Sandaracinaceae bacterium]
MTENEHRPLASEALRALPVFPLPRVVFFPGSVLPLHVFEPRYRDMMEHCVSADGHRAMAIATLADGWEDDYEGNPPIHDIACAGRIVEHQRRPDGRFDLVLAGVHRVRLAELPMTEPLRFRRADATLLEDRSSPAVQQLLPSVMATAASVAALVRETYPDFTLGLDDDPSPGLLADRIADRLVTETSARRRLLEAQDVKVRLAHLVDELVELLAHLRGQGHGGALH